MFTCNDMYAQNDSSYIRLDTITLKQKAVKFKESKLYDIQEEKDNENIHGFYALSIFENTLDKQIWVSHYCSRWSWIFCILYLEMGN